jgi:hypothetical protein
MNLTTLLPLMLMLFSESIIYCLPDEDALNAANGFATIANVNSHTVQHVKQHNWDYDILRNFFL